MFFWLFIMEYKMELVSDLNLGFLFVVLCFSSNIFPPKGVIGAAAHCPLQMVEFFFSPSQLL